MLAGLKLGAAAGVAGFAIGFGAGAWAGWEWRDGRAAKADRERMEQAERQRIRNADRADWGARSFEEERDAIRRDLLATLTPPALSAAVPQCPALEVGAVVLPAGSLDRVRAAAGELGADADAGEPRPALPPGASAPGR